MTCWVICLGIMGESALGQAPVAGAVTEGTVQLNLRGAVPLETLINYVSDRLNVKFLYQSDLSTRQVTIHTPAEIPVSSLMTLLGSVLRTENLAIVDADVAGWKRIVDVAELPQFAAPGEADQVLRQDGPASPVTQVFVLQNMNAQTLSQLLRPFLSKAGANIIAQPEGNVLIVTDFARNVATAAQLIELLDRPAGETAFEFYEVQHQPSTTLGEQVRGILGQGTGVARTNGTTPKRLELFDEPYGNRIIVAGEKSLVERAMALLKQLDISLGMTTQVYRVRNLTAERLDNILQGFLAPQDANRTYQSTVDEDGNLLVVRATPEIHSQIAKLLEELDRPARSAESPIQFYKLKNARAIDVLYSLLALQEAYGLNGPYGGGGFYPGGGVTPFGTAPGFGGFAQPLYPGLVPGMQSPINGSQIPPQPGEIRSRTDTIPMTRLPLSPGENGVEPRASNLIDNTNPLAMPLQAGLGFQYGAGGAATLPGGARVSADVSTNSLIVVAPSNVQPMYARLIESLDQRRPQVLIEAKVVAIDTTDDFSLGVEISIGDRDGAKRLFKFTSFGLSEVDPFNGALTIIPGLGFNGTLVDPDVADVVVRALSRHSRAKVLSAPKILVNDNATGTLESVTSVPFASVNASQTVSTTSLGGNQTAGTIITLTPHINEDNHLQLEFDVEFSSFGEGGTDVLPPPRRIDRVGSTVTIPDGQTIIVGGLKRVSETKTFLGVPWVEYVPILRELTSRTDEKAITTSFFLFIRPVVLRDTRFADLKFLSDRDVSRAGIPGEYPVSLPVLIP